MGEFFAEAQVLIRPNAADFAASLKAQVEAAIAEVGPQVVPVEVVAGATGAGKAAAAETAAATGAIDEQAVAAGADSAALKTLTVQQEDLAAAAALVAESTTALAAIENAGALTTTDLSKAKSELAAANKALTVSQEALDASLASGDAILASSARANLAAAAAEVENANAAALLAAEQVRAAGGTAAHLLAQRQLTKGAVAQTASFAGLRAGTLAASGPFIAATASVIIFAKALKEASARNEELNKTSVVFGKSAKEIQAFAKTTASSLGISEVEALKSTGVFGNLFHSIGIARPIAAGMSETLVKLAADMASFNNADPSRVLEALRAGLVGQARPLRVLGVFLSQARVQEEALLETGKQHVQQLTNENLVRARFNLILKDTAVQQGDVARTADRLANQSRFLAANLADAAGNLGRVLQPAALFTVQAFNDLFVEMGVASDRLQKFGGEAKQVASDIGQLSPVKFIIEFINKFPGGGGGSARDFFKHLKADVEIALGAAAVAAGTATSEIGVGLAVGAGGAALFAKGLHDLNAEANASHVPVKRLADDLDQGARQLHLAAFAAVEAARAFKGLGSTLNALEFKQLNIQTGRTPGGRPAEEANLQQQIAQQNKIVDKTISGTKARRLALTKLKGIQDQLDALTAQDQADADKRAAAAKAATTKRQEAARKAATAQEKSAQAFIDLFSPKQQRLQNRLTTAQTFGTVRQQIAVNEAILAADKAEIKALHTFIKNKHLKGDALKTALAEITTLQQDEFTTRTAIRQLQAPPTAQALFDFQTSHLEAALSIAETTKGTKDDQRALKAIIAHDNARITALKKISHKTLEEKTELDNLRVDVAQRNKALRDLTDTSKNTQHLLFEFLQTQSGFAANLLGNLIPGGATGGLVGGTSSGQPGAASFANAAVKGTRPSEDVRRSTATIAGGPTRGGQASQTQLLRHIASILDKIYRGTGHPEAKHRQARNLRDMDLSNNI